MVGWGNGLILGYMMYRTQLVPRAWTWLGLVGGPLIILSGTIVMFGGGHPSGSLQGFATIPEAAWELFLGVYCTIWGFRRNAPILARDAQLSG
jgi:peptidoglycan/LPS O-acetylase OafA/YrhL